jgi:phospholipid/cholesterol/gamma-HCH transport system ATP-binding protein
MIEVKHVNKSFGKTQVLRDISTTFEKGKVNLIIGQSGHGKTVLAKCIVGLHEVDSGEILFDDRDFCKMNRVQRTAIRQEIGMLFQGSALFDSMTVEENVMFPLVMFKKMTKKEMLDRVNFCLERVNLTGRNALFPSECSGGMQKRIGIARAIAMNPKYLFCDEPNSGLDPKTAILIDNLIREITQEYQITTVINTHDMNSVLEIGDKVIYLFDGKKEWEGASEDILHADNELLNKFVFASNLFKRIKSASQ